MEVAAAAKDLDTALVTVYCSVTIVSTPTTLLSCKLDSARSRGAAGSKPNTILFALKPVATCKVLLIAKQAYYNTESQSSYIGHTVQRKIYSNVL